MNKTIYKHVIKLLKLLFIITLISGCFEKDEYESLKKHDKNNNKIIDEFENYVNTEVDGEDLASQDLKELLFKIGVVFYEVINEKKLNKKKALMYSKKNLMYSRCIDYIASKRSHLSKYNMINEFNILSPRVFLSKLIVSKEIYKKRARYNGLLHGRTRIIGPRICKLKLKDRYE